MKSEFEKIPGVGSKIAKYIEELGIQNTAQLAQANPEKMYTKFCVLRGEKIDRCLLYVFRGAVTFAQKPHQKQWWEFKERSNAARRSPASVRRRPDKY
jgi:hypothetical protein